MRQPDLDRVRRASGRGSARPIRPAPRHRCRTGRRVPAPPPRAHRPAGRDRRGRRAAPPRVLVNQGEGGARHLLRFGGARVPSTMPLASVVLPAPRLPISSTAAPGGSVARQPLAERDGLLLRGGPVCRHIPPWRREDTRSRSVAMSALLADLARRRSRPPGRAGRPRRPRLPRAARGTAPRKPAIKPVRMSPVPPVAMAGLPVGLIHTRPSGKAIRVRWPLSTRQTWRSSAKSRGAGGARRPRSRRTVLPVSRAISPGCGVRTRSRPPVDHFVPASAFRRVGVQHHGLGELLHRAAHHRHGIGVGAQARPDGDHVLALRDGLQAAVIEGAQRNAARLGLAAAARS